MKKNKIAVLFMSILLAFTLAACGSRDSGNNSQAARDLGGGSASEESVENAGAEQKAGSKKTLVVYYSASGNTEAVAGYIADAADASLFELVPAEPYSDADLDWTDDGSRVVYEHDNPDERDVELVETSVPDWDSYDTVFIGASDIIRTS